jgi:hypothetical protein
MTPGLSFALGARLNIGGICRLASTRALDFFAVIVPRDYPYSIVMT